ncbi:MAG: adenylate/guanylate cyclase domain-containing protein [Anaerolineae bacterium]
MTTSICCRRWPTTPRSPSRTRGCSANWRRQKSARRHARQVHGRCDHGLLQHPVGPARPHAAGCARGCIDAARHRRGAHAPATAARLSFGIGIAGGDAVVGNIGAWRSMNYTVIGDCVNLARRLQENARGGQILVDGWTYQRIQDKVLVRSLGEMHVKGRSGRLPVFELIALK